MFLLIQSLIHLLVRHIAAIKHIKTHQNTPKLPETETSYTLYSLLLFCCIFRRRGDI